MSDFDLDGLFIEPRPDEDAWEAFLELALDRIGGDRSPGLSNRKIGELEEVVGCQLPFEVGLLLVMGVPVDERWWQWDDPATQWAEWNNQVVQGFAFDVEHKDIWFDVWGQKPAGLADQLRVVQDEFATNVPATFPLFGHRAVPLTAADGQPSSDGNPVFSIHQSDVIIYGADLAAWMHAEFGVPLPMWPSDERRFPFWTDVIESS